MLAAKHFPMIAAGGMRGLRTKNSSIASTLAMSTSRRYTPLSMKDKVILITGATAGIGKSTAWRFADEGSKLILVGRRSNVLDTLEKEIKAEYPSLSILTIPMSVSNIDAVSKLPASLPAEFKDVEVLVNNAGLALGVSSVEGNSMEDVKTMMETNVLGLVAFCTAFLPGMKERGRGHIVNMGSIAGHVPYSGGTGYNASKFAVKGYTSAARHDLISTPIRITHISPGMVGNTEFSNVRFGDDKKAADLYSNIVPLNPDDIADNVLYAVTRPENVQIAEIIVFCNNQAGPKEIARVGPSFGRN